MTKRALITGGTGQDGWYLSERLTNLGYAVHIQTRQRVRRDHDYAAAVNWHSGDLTDQRFLTDLVSSICPDEIYNLAAVSRPALTWMVPFETASLNALVPQQICELMRRYCPGSRLFQASSSEIFGETSSTLQDEETPCVPRSPYGIAKAYAHRIIGAYRSQYDLHVSSGILFNHESPRRPLAFVSQKIAHAAAALSLGLSETTASDERGRPILLDAKVRLGDLTVCRDFGYAADYVEAMHMMLSCEKPDDFVIGTGAHHSIAEFCEAAFKLVGFDWRDHVLNDPDLIRKTDSHYTRANPAKINKKLGWRATTSFDELVRILVEHQIKVISSSGSAGRQ
jgi:GDPmannose 4,6-dehydratase